MHIREIHMTHATRPIGFWLKTVDRLIDERFEATLGAAGITRRQWQLMNTLADGARTGAELDDAVRPFLDAAGGETSASHLGSLTARGIVVEVGGHYRLTQEGVALRQELGVSVRQTRQLVTDGLDEEDYVRTVATLEKMAANLGWSLGD